MFSNKLTGLSEEGKKKFDAVCVHLNGVMRKMGLTHLDGEEDQILIDLWMDTFPYKLDSKGNRIPRIIKEKTIETQPVYDEEGKVIGGKNVTVIRERKAWELNFERSLIDITKVGIYKWRGEQLLINKIKYLFGDRRTRKVDEDGKGQTEIKIDAWGNARVRAVFEEGVDPKKMSKRDLSRNLNECDMLRPDGEQMSLDDMGVSDPTAQLSFEESTLMMTLRGNLSESEVKLAERLMEGESVNQLYKSDSSITATMMRRLKEKVAYALGRSDLLKA